MNADGTLQVSFGPDLTPWPSGEQRRLRAAACVGAIPRRLRAAEALARPRARARLGLGLLPAGAAPALEAVGVFDEAFFLYEEDVDLCLRLRKAGWRVVFTPAAEVVHRLGRSMATAPSARASSTTAATCGSTASTTARC